MRLKQFAVPLFFLCFGRYSVMVFLLFKRVLKIPRERGGGGSEILLRNVRVVGRWGMVF